MLFRRVLLLTAPRRAPASIYSQYRSLQIQKNPYRRTNDSHNDQDQRQRQYQYQQIPLWQTRRFWYTTGVAGTGGAIYYQVHLEDSPTGRRRFINVTSDDEQQAGLQAYLSIISQYRNQLEPRGTPTDLYVRRIAQRIIKATGMQGDWEIHVIRSPEKNAFVLPGGKIFVFSGILSVAANEDGLATVLSHEIAHQYARHSAEKLSQASLLQFVYLVASLFVDPSVLQIGQAMSGLLLELPNSRQCEQEADQLGLYFMASACYDPREAVGLWERMKTAESVSPPQFLNTHPSTDSRIESIKKWIPQAETKREAANCPNPEVTRSFFARALN
ncbi:metalloendopeptidase [Kickxella alabastrina]|uniref:Metalloendopeptidase n=1 Tax=Kickxella alabastrina TaxID=61397 RepID=A0ACC1IU11_9FUNG|nr:metalloendopeptidase [Kickxella alabastrina]